MHLEHEISLVITTSFLTSASLISVYRLSFPTAGDLLYIWISILWLSRHLIHRFICTTDVVTSLSPWQHKLRWGWIAVTSGGQYFDTPSSIWIDVVGGGRTSDLSGVDDAMVDGAVVVPAMNNAHLIPSVHRLFIAQRIILSPVAVIWATCCLICKKKGPSAKDLLDSKSKTNSSSFSHNRNKSKQSHHRAPSDHNSAYDRRGHESWVQHYYRCRNKLNRKLDVWWQCAPHCQQMANIAVICLIFCFFRQHIMMHSSYDVSMREGLSGGHKWFRFGSQHGLTKSKNPRVPNGRLGTSGDVEANSEFDLELNSEFLAQKFEMSQGTHARDGLRAREFIYGPFGIIGMISIWGTAMSILFYRRLILPLPDLIADNSIYAGRGSYSKASKTRKMNDNHKAWSEQSKPIMSENRFFLHLKVIALRVIEYVIVCALLPRTEYVCKATGHCEIETMVFESGNPTAVEARGHRMFYTLVYDRFLGFIVVSSVLFSTSVILISQVITLDKSYLALKGYVSNHETNSSSSVMKKPGRKSNTHTESITFDFPEGYNNNGNLNQSRGFVNSLERWKKSVYELFSNELGALTTSRVLSICANAHLTFSLLVTLTWLLFIVLGRDWYALVLVYIALFASALEIGFLDRHALGNIAREINATYKK